MKRLLLVCSACFVLLSISVPLFAADWPQWRGPNRDGLSKDTGLLQEWPPDGPKLRWKAADIGTGYSAPSVAAGKIYVQTTHGDDEFALVLNEKDGKEIWSTKIGGVGKNQGPQYPGSRSTPTVDGDRVYCLASDGQLVCLASGGKEIWRKSYSKDFDGKVGNSPTSYNWAYSESVLVDGDAVICTPGGATATLVALNKMTGDVIWKCAVPEGDPADYASIEIAKAGDTKEYVQFLRKGVVGVDAKTGKFLWRYDKTAHEGASIFTPVVSGNKVFTSSGRGHGGALLELSVAGDKATATEVYFDKALSASLGGAVLVDGALYGTTDQAMFCADSATGKTLWRERGVGPASVCYADGRIYARGFTGDVALIEASTAEYHEKGRFKQPDISTRPAWPHPVVANGGLYLRDQDLLLCYEVKAGP